MSSVPEFGVVAGFDVRRVSAELRGACERTVGGARHYSILFSGGLDSSLVAHLLRESAPRLVVIGTDDSADWSSATEGARLLGMPVEQHRISQVDVSTAFRRWNSEVAGLREPSRSVALSVTLALTASSDRVVVCGQGADELFHGYSHFRGLSSIEAMGRSEEDWERLIGIDWPLAQRIAQELEHQLLSPYLDARFVEMVRELPPELHVFDGESKPLLRRVAEELSLPTPLVHRPKKAMQYGSGVARLLRELERTAATPSAH